MMMLPPAPKVDIKAVSTAVYSGVPTPTVTSPYVSKGLVHVDGRLSSVAEEIQQYIGHLTTRVGKYKYRQYPFRHITLKYLFPLLNVNKRNVSRKNANKVCWCKFSNTMNSYKNVEITETLSFRFGW